MTMIQHRGRPGPFPVSYLERIYAMPRPTLWLHEWQRQRNLDLGAMDDVALHRERRCVQRRLDYEPDAARHAWLMRRIAAIDGERDRRRRVPASVRPRRRTTDTVVTVAGQMIDLPIPGGRHGHE